LCSYLLPVILVFSLCLLAPSAHAQRGEADVLAAQGVLAYDDGRYEDALELLKRATELDPRHARGLYYLGLTHLTLKQPEGLDDAALSKVLGKHLKGLQGYMLLLMTIIHHGHLDTTPPSAMADSFLVAEQARSWLVQAAVARAMARRAAAGTGEDRLAREVEDLRRRRQTLWMRLNESHGRLRSNGRKMNQST
jgi:hypothetical protein